jgi:16S rRNA (guanine966-N2)-methyltransferase
MAQRPRPKNTPSSQSSHPTNRDTVGVRIIGGQFRGRKLAYSGDLRTRPMKDRLREAVFNLLGPAVRGTHAVDLFAGTGALGLEALSRGAAKATFIEQHFPTAELIRKNAASLGAAGNIEVVPGNTFIWAKRAALASDLPWTVFCSPPYCFYVERLPEMLKLIEGLLQAAPEGSAFVVESDDQFDFQQLPDSSLWDVRAYPPAVVGLYKKRTDS